MIDESTYENFTFTFTIFSIITSIFFIKILNKNPTNYGKLVVHVVMSEAISLYCVFLFILRIEKYLYLQNLSRTLFNYLTFNKLSQIAEKNLEEYKDINTRCYKIITKLMIKFNVSAYYSTEIFSLLLSVFICLEIIFVLKNPLAQMKNRLKSYFTISYILATIIFILNAILMDFKIEDLESENIDLLYKKVFYSDFGV